MDDFRSSRFDALERAGLFAHLFRRSLSINEPHLCAAGKLFPAALLRSRIFSSTLRERHLHQHHQEVQPVFGPPSQPADPHRTETPECTAQDSNPSYLVRSAAIQFCTIVMGRACARVTGGCSGVKIH